LDSLRQKSGIDEKQHEKRFGIALIPSFFFAVTLCSTSNASEN
jgi:hypothetical protein